MTSSLRLNSSMQYIYPLYKLKLNPLGYKYPFRRSLTNHTSILIRLLVELWISYICQTPDLPILPSPAIDWKIWKALYSRWCLSVVCHPGNSSDVTLAFEDDQVIWPFSREETDNTGDTDDTDNTDDTYDTEDTVYTYDTEDTDQTYDTE